MMPPIVSPDAPPGERLVFQRLAEDPDCADWIVLHSLHLAEVRRALEGEVDFVIFIPGAGVLCLEVKSHRTVRCSNGTWYLGGDPPTAKSPFAQAARGMHAILDFLGRKRADVQQVPFWSAVWFTHAAANVPVDTPEWHDWQLLDRHDLRKPASAALMSVMRNARTRFASRFAHFDAASGIPSADTCSRLANQLRPQFELSLTPKQISRERAAERLAFVEEQYDALDLMEQEPRALFTGPAGTGKSFLAIEAARRAAARGGRVLFVCYNRLLGAAMERSVGDAELISASTFHAYMLRTVATPAPDPAPPNWWEQTLPDLALDVLLDGQGSYFDVLIVDEAQDLLSRPAYLDVLDASLIGGLAGGRWLMFGDFERQMLYGEGEDGRPHLRQRCPHFAHPTLGHNCRNTPQIGVAASRLAGLADSAYKGFRRRDDGIRPEFRAYESDEEQEELLAQAVDALKAEHYSNDEIVVLSPYGATSTAARLAEQGWLKLDRFGTRAGKIGYTTIHSFKGLDSAAVIVTDISEVSTAAAESMFYVGLSRASDRLFVLAHKTAMTQMAGILISGRA